MITLCRPMASMPVFAKAGAIIPMANYTDNRLNNSADMDVLVFPGADNTFVMYEDAGEGHEFETGAFCQTEMRLIWGEQAQFVIEPACGQQNLIPAVRKWNIHLRGFHKSVAVKVTVDGAAAEATCCWDPQTNSMIVTLQASTASNICLEIQGNTLIHDNADWLDRCASIINAAELAYHTKDQLWVAGALGAVAHAIGQMAVAIAMTATPGIIVYLPVLIVTSIITGLFTGFCAQFLVKRGKDIG